MADRATLDPDVVIEDTGLDNTTPWTRYRSLATGARWIVRGVCNQCGLCVVGAGFPEHYAWDGDPGTPLAVRDLRYGTRLDEPVTPRFIDDMQRAALETPTATVAGCSLSAEEL